MVKASKQATKKDISEKLPKPKKISTKSKEEGEIKEASIAKFMRKRTQLVGFDYGLYKHTQYSVEFVDNALDAIEKFQWDSKTALEELRNNMGIVSIEFDKFEEDVNQLSQSFQENEENSSKEQIKRLKNLIGKPNEILEKIFQVEQELLSKIGFTSGSQTEISSTQENEDLKNKKINTANFTEEYKKFINQFNDLKEKYNKISEDIDNLEQDPRFMFTLDKEISLENLSYLPNYTENSNGTMSEQIKENLKSFLDPSLENNDDEITNDEMGKSENESSENQLEMQNQSIEIESSASVSTLVELKPELNEEEEVDDEQARELRKLKKKEKELEVELQNLVNSLEDFISPVIEIIDNEPIIIVKLREEEAPDVFQEKGERSDTFLYTFEIFDNGTGMKPDDLLKYGKYLASSKSQKLRQTRGSQGFGSPSAFSDAQNTTGRPITVVSKHSSQIYGICSEFYTTDKNTKVYVVSPEEIECSFLHGTYVKLQYLNKKYIRGYVDAYVEKTAMMNSHVTFLYIDPYGQEHIFPRRVSFFPKEPKYALPHPSSVKIGDFQDLLRSSENLTVTAFLTDNFVRMSNSLAKSIVEEAEFEIERKLNYLNLKSGFISVITKKGDPLIYVREEERVFGRSSKPRMKRVVYAIPDGDFKDSIWEYIKIYNQSLKHRESFEKKIKSIDKSIQKESEKGKIKEQEKEIKQIEKEIADQIKNMEDSEKNLDKILSTGNYSEELTDSQTVDKILEIINELMISKTRPAELTQSQIEYLYMAFKNQKYMSPPTDTAIPVGESALETAIIKQYNLTVSNRVDYFGNSDDEIKQMGDFERIKIINKNLSKFNDEKFKNQDLDFSKLKTFDNSFEKSIYEQVILELDLVHTMGDDFVAAHTRKPTSGKGLAFVVEAVMAYSSNNIPPAKKASQVLSRYVNRTPKLRDNADCALWLGVQNVNWKNYKIPDTFDNGFPKGNYVIYINCSGPYTHLMFKSQSKNALAEDEVLLKEVKFCLEVIGRKIRNYMGKREIREQRKKRSKLIEKNIPLFIESVYNIAKSDPKYKDLKKTSLENMIGQALAIDSDPNANQKQISETRAQIVPSNIMSKMISKPEEELKEPKEELKEPKEELKEPKEELKEPKEELKEPKEEIKELEQDNKNEENQSKISNKRSIKKSVKKSIKKEDKKVQAQQELLPKASKQEEKKEKQSIESSKTENQVFELNNEGILKALSDKEWHTTSDLVKIMRIKNRMDARFLQIKLKALATKDLISAGKKNEKYVWRIK